MEYMFQPVRFSRSGDNKLVRNLSHDLNHLMYCNHNIYGTKLKDVELRINCATYENLEGLEA